MGREREFAALRAALDRTGALVVLAGEPLRMREVEYVLSVEKPGAAPVLHRLSIEVEESGHAKIEILGPG